MSLTSLKELLSSVTNESRDTTNILAYWEALEYFQEISFPKPVSSKADSEESRLEYIVSETELSDFIYSHNTDDKDFRLYVGGVSKFELLTALYNRIPAEEDNKRFRKLLEKN